MMNAYLNLGHPGAWASLAGAANAGPSDQTQLETRPMYREFGHYQLRHVLGQGGMGTVYEAYDLNLKRHVALKMLVNEEDLTPTMRRRFLIGAEAAARLDHPNIVPIYEIGEIDHRPYFSMKMIEGMTLREQLNRLLELRQENRWKQEFPDRQRQAALLIASIARAVHHAHQHHVVHRDLKPGNILIEPDGKPYLTDFGLAKLVAHSEQSDLHRTDSLPGTIMGTPCYMSPEQASGAMASPASDIYSLGVVLYELLTGHPPFRAATPFDTMRQIVEDEPTRPRQLEPAVDRELETICLKCLEKDPHRRYASAAIVAEELERWARGEPIKTRTAGIGCRLRKWAARNPLGAWLILSLVVGIILTLTGQITAAIRAKHLRNLTNLWVLDWMRQTQDSWSRPDGTSLLVTSEMLHLLANNIAGRDTSGDSIVRLGLAVVANGHPVTASYHYAGPLVFLERQLSKELGSRVSLDLYLLKPDTWLDTLPLPAGVNLLWANDAWVGENTMVPPGFQVLLRSADVTSPVGSILAGPSLSRAAMEAVQRVFPTTSVQRRFDPQWAGEPEWVVPDGVPTGSP